jgi:hypothetical protein
VSFCERRSQKGGGIVCAVSERKKNEEWEENRLNNIILIFLFYYYYYYYICIYRYFFCNAVCTRVCRDTYLFLYPTLCFFTQQTQFQKPPARRFNMANNNFKGSIINGPLAESVNDFLPLGLFRSMFDNIHKSHHQNSPLRVYVCVNIHAPQFVHTCP